MIKIKSLCVIIFVSLVIVSCSKNEEVTLTETPSKNPTQTSYYVDGTNGSDSNTGLSAANAWKTIQKACNSATPGSTVYIKSGSYYENIVVNVSGTAGSPIYFRNFENDAVIIDGTNTSGTALLSITDKSHLVFRNLQFRNLVKNNAVGIFIECSEDGTVTSLHFKNLVVHDIKWVNNTSTIPGDDDNAQPFIAYGRGTTSARAITDIVVDSCEFYNNITGYSESVSLDGNIDGFSLTNNQVHDNTNIGLYAGGNYGECSVATLDHARNGIIEKNTCYHNVSDYATSGGIYADGAWNVTIQKNICYGNGYGIEVGCEENGTTDSIIVINNLIYNNQDAGIAVGGWTTSTTGQVLNCTFRNNTLYQNDVANNGSGEFYITKASSCNFINNVMFTNSENTLLSLEKISPQTSNTFNYNCYYTPSGSSSNITINWRGKTYSTFASYKKGISQDNNSLFSNPALVNVTSSPFDLNIQAGSPCIDAGNPSTILITGETDFAGNTRMANSKIDIGAYEHQ